MTFPLYLPVGPVLVHPHWVFESLAYLLGFRLYLWLRARIGDPLAWVDRMSIVTAAILGAAIGSKLMFWLGDPAMAWQHRADVRYLMAGKSIVGGLIGGLLAVEWVKRRLHIARSTGDLFAIPLAVGTAIGRVGCFLSGLGDHTYGHPTRVPWGIDFGDGILRHPTQLYEVAWLMVLTVWLCRMMRQPHHEGDLFKFFMIGYCGFRWVIEFFKPGVSLAGLTAIQWACLAMLCYYRHDIWRLLRDQGEPKHA